MSSINANSLNSLFGSSAAGSSSFLTDYMSIKNGSYYKMLKAHYSQQEEELGLNQPKNELTKLEKNELLDVKTAADDLAESVSKLTATGNKSLFGTIKKEITDEETGETKTVDAYDVDGITGAVKDFVKNYNSLIESSLKANNTDVVKKAALMINTTKMNKKMLGEVGISIGANGKLSLDEAKFKDTDMTKVKSLFNDSKSYGSQIQSKANEISGVSSRTIANSNTGYGKTGTYRTHAYTGSLFDGYL